MFAVLTTLALLTIGLSGLVLVGSTRVPTDERERAAEADALWVAELRTLNDAMTRLHKHRAKVARREARGKP